MSLSLNSVCIGTRTACGWWAPSFKTETVFLFISLWDWHMKWVQHTLTRSKFLETEQARMWELQGSNSPQRAVNKNLKLLRNCRWQIRLRRNTSKYYPFSGKCFTLWQGAQAKFYWSRENTKSVYWGLLILWNRFNSSQPCLCILLNEEYLYTPVV